VGVTVGVDVWVGVTVGVRVLLGVKVTVTVLVGVSVGKDAGMVGLGLRLQAKGRKPAPKSKANSMNW
jgi:hypothetical protein